MLLSTCWIPFALQEIRNEPQIETLGPELEARIVFICFILYHEALKIAGKPTLSESYPR